MFTLNERSALLKSLKTIMKYLKLVYKLACSVKCDGISSQCPFVVLSDPYNKKLALDCTKHHELSCAKCESIVYFFQDLKKTLLTSK